MSRHWNELLSKIFWKDWEHCNRRIKYRLKFNVTQEFLFFYQMISKKMELIQLILFWTTTTRLSPDRFAPICNRLRDGNPGKPIHLTVCKVILILHKGRRSFPCLSSPTRSGTSHWPQVRQAKGLITSHGVKIASRSGHHHIFPRTCHSLWLPQSMSRDNNININILQFQLRVFQSPSFHLHHADFPRNVLLFGRKKRRMAAFHRSHGKAENR